MCCTMCSFSFVMLRFSLLDAQFAGSPAGLIPKLTSRLRLAEIEAGFISRWLHFESGQKGDSLHDSRFLFILLFC